MARFAYLCGIHCAHPKDTFFQFNLQLGAKLLVISQLTISILGVLRRHHRPFATDPHTGMGANIGNSTNSKSSSSNNNKVGRPKLAQSNTYLQLTQDRRMQSTMKNLTFVARYVRCAITKKACVSKVAIPLLLWLNAFFLGNQIHTSQRLRICPKNVGWSHRPGLCIPYAHLWAIAYFVPCFDALGSPQTVGVM